jgi:hypothetical protein
MELKFEGEKKEMFQKTSSSVTFSKFTFTRTALGLSQGCAAI